ncbi:MOSC domain-containing protein [Cryptosporangium aurantiacum]|uniref:MOSC domain-containing protein YiiM n=1 Tax=Cryptosporangium aurantiacum TaxID=134849 RepID=A0A1M7Q5W6_9ACTN|nr:MOSC domain-containing protein [Cryptosporangium aurantiacum]SHN25819.1 MOSC domain-containing protein YiiM [Cryptosporangium aurantiacum]
MILPAAGAVQSVNIGVLRVVPWTQSVGSTGIDKRPVDGRVRAEGVGLVGDVIADTKNHGGYDQAVYAYAREDAAWWAAELDRELPFGAFGENLSTTGVDCTGAVIGERWAVGSTVLEVSRPRIPCRTFAGFWDVPDLIKRFTHRAVPGAYLRIIEEGELGAGDEVRVISRPGHGVTIGEVFRALTGERSLAPRLLEAPELPSELHDRARKFLAPASSRRPS